MATASSIPSSEASIILAPEVVEYRKSRAKCLKDALEVLESDFLLGMVIRCDDDFEQRFEKFRWWQKKAMGLRHPYDPEALYSLEEIKLESSEIKSLSKEIRCLPKLTVLKVGYNALKELPDEISCLIKLEELHAQENELRELPDTIGELEKLRLLMLEGNSFHTLNNKIGKLHLLKRLLLSHNKLIEMPTTIEQLVKLQELDLRANRLKELPDEIKGLVSLRRLDLRQNKLVALPETIGALKALEVLYCDKNKIKRIPEGSILKSPRDLSEGDRDSEEPELWLSSNALADFPKEIFSSLRDLEVLRLDRNEIQLVSKAIAENLPNLRVITLRENPLESVGHPLTMARWLQELKAIDFIHEVVASESKGADGNDDDKGPTEQKEEGNSHGSRRRERSQQQQSNDDSSDAKSEEKGESSQISTDEDASGSAGNADEKGQIQDKKIPVERLMKEADDVLARVKVLDLSQKTLRAIPSQLRCCGHLVKLDLSVNKLKTIPKELCELVFLQKLNLEHQFNFEDSRETCCSRVSATVRWLFAVLLGHNKLRRVPKEIGNLRGLTLLDMTHNELVELPDTIADLKVNLDDWGREQPNGKMRGGSRTLSKLIEMKQSMRTLWIRGNKIRDLPESMATLAGGEFTIFYMDRPLKETATAKKLAKAGVMCLP
eukprot:jgi/Bigna1/80939/fgenesh1_pg.76_\